MRNFCGRLGPLWRTASWVALSHIAYQHSQTFPGVKSMCGSMFPDHPPFFPPPPHPHEPHPPPFHGDHPHCPTHPAREWGPRFETRRHLPARPHDAPCGCGRCLDCERAEHPRRREPRTPRKAGVACR